MTDYTVHPVSLNLNLTEISFLTVILPSIVEGEGRDIVHGIAKEVYSQLSDYAKEKIDSLKANMSQPDSQNTSRIQATGVRGYQIESKDSLHYFFKNRKQCSIAFKEGGMVTGKIDINNMGQWQITEAGSGKIITFSEEDIDEVKPAQKPH